MVTSALATEVTGAIREFGAEIDAQDRALGTSVRILAAPAASPCPALATVDASRDWVIVDKSITRC
jgi:hypothetical protein